MTFTNKSTVRGADALIQTLLLSGVKKVFTLSGNHIMPVFDAAFATDIELIHTRHEAATVHMADAFARITGEVGIALVTGGPGHANAISALYTALMAESPVVLLSGHAPVSQLGKGAFQEMRQADLAAPLCKASWTCQSVDEIAADMAKAIRIAKSGRPGPVHLSLPSDVLEATTSVALPSKDAFAPAPLTISSVDVDAIARRLVAATRPLILTGPASLTSAQRERVTGLEAASGIPVVGMESPRGVTDPSLGAFAECLAESDCILLLGKPLDFTLKFGATPTFAANCAWLQIDSEQSEIDRALKALGSRLAVTTIADAASAIDALTQSHLWSPSRATAWREKVKSSIAYRPVAWATATTAMPGRLHPVQALAPLQALLDDHPDAVFVSDGGEIGQWAQALLSAPHRVINGVAGAIGAALPFALGARVALPDAPIVAVMGDGTFGFHCSEFDTAVRYDLPFVMVIGNDARWNAEYQIQLRDYGRERTIGCELLPSHYDKIAAAFGAHGESVTSPAELLPAASRAAASSKPACINVFIEGLPAPNIRR
ncbi:MAG: thiamine pyrophosphate-binding protein [Casimicrobium sp.]